MKMSFPSDERIRQIKQDVERIKKTKADPLKIAGELTDFIIKVHMEQLKRKYPKATESELIALLRKQFMETKKKWRAIWKDLQKE